MKKENISKLIPNIQNVYEIYENGDIVNFKTNKKLSKTIEKDGYYVTSLQTLEKKSKQFFVHRLVAMAFVKNEDPSKRKIVDHIDRDRKNCNANNLRWATYSENVLNSDYDYVKNLGKFATTGRTIYVYDENKQFLFKGKIKEVMKFFNLSEYCIYRRINHGVKNDKRTFTVNPLND